MKTSTEMLKYLEDQIKERNMAISSFREIDVDEYNRYIAILRNLLSTYMYLIEWKDEDEEYSGYYTQICKSLKINYPHYMKPDGSFEREGP